MQVVVNATSPVIYRRSRQREKIKVEINNQQNEEDRNLPPEVVSPIKAFPEESRNFSLISFLSPLARLNFFPSLTEEFLECFDLESTFFICRQREKIKVEINNQQNEEDRNLPPEVVSPIKAEVVSPIKEENNCQKNAIKNEQTGKMKKVMF
jgi:RNA-binding protein YhbY